MSWGKLLGIFALVVLVACERRGVGRTQGYVEGEFVYVASPHAGALRSLAVSRGTQVKSGEPLFSLDDTLEKAARDESESRLGQARASLEDAKKGLRPPEIEAIEAQLKQVRAALELAERELTRRTKLSKTGAVAQQELDQALSTRDQNFHRVVQLDAELATAKLGSRSDQVTAAEANVKALDAALARAQWDLSQKIQNAPEAGVVFDTLYREGEWVEAGKPVVALLPPRGIKVRAFVPEPAIGMVHVGDRAQVFADGRAAPADGTVSFISPRAEFTPPVIFSRESRSKLVFMIEISFDPTIAAELHPGQPVDVDIMSGDSPAGKATS